VIELDWWGRERVGGVEFELVPVQHWSARGLDDRNRTLWGGWAVFAPDLRWYFSGDTGYSKLFAQTRERLASHVRDGHLFDVALLAIGAYEPRWFMSAQHMNPAEAVQAHKDVAARRSIGIHWGTFALTDEALDQPPRDLAAARAQQGVPEQDFLVLPIGGTWWPAGPPAAAAKQ
jgi:N-acyl-phosphatidylethanolamine-hydrolysing phospholipase D